MSPRTRSSLIFTMLGICSLAVLGAVVAAPNATARRTAGVKVAFLSTQPAGDHGVTDDMISYFKKAEKTLPIDGKLVESTDPSTFNQDLRSLCSAGYKVVITDFLEMQKPLADIAPTCPGTKFIHIYGDADHPAIRNVYRIAYKYWDGEFLAGMFAAAVTQTGKVGYEAGAETPAIAGDANAYLQGAHLENPKVKVKMVISGSGFTDPAKSHDAAAALFAQGYNPIQTDDDQVGPIRAAHEKGGLAITAEPLQMQQNPKNVPAIVYIRYGLSLYQSLQKALKPGWKGAYVALGGRQGIIGLQISKTFRGSPQVTKAIRAVIPKINRYAHEIETGKYTVKYNSKWHGD